MDPSVFVRLSDLSVLISLSLNLSAHLGKQLRKDTHGYTHTLFQLISLLPILLRVPSVVISPCSIFLLDVQIDRAADPEFLVFNEFERSFGGGGGAEGGIIRSTSIQEFLFSFNSVSFPSCQKRYLRCATSKQ